MQISTKTKLTLTVFLEYAVWGSYLTSMGIYLASINMGNRIGWFYATQGVVSLFMPALMGMIADRWIEAQRLFRLCHFFSALFMFLFASCCMMGNVSFWVIFPIYFCSVALFIPTVALCNSICYNALADGGDDPVSAFPPIRLWGTVGFIISMWIINFMGYQDSYMQFFFRALIGVVLVIFAFSLPKCKIVKHKSVNDFGAIFSLKFLSLFKKKEMATFFIFSMLLGICLQITNGYAGPYIDSFTVQKEFANNFFVKNSILLISLSQISEIFFMLLIPFFMKRFGFKRVILISMIAWMLRFALLGWGDPGSGVWLFIISMVIYGVAFDFFHIAGSIFVEKNTDKANRSMSQGLFMMMANGVGASIGMIIAQKVVNSFTGPLFFNGRYFTVGEWDKVWFIFAGFALFLAVIFAAVFRPAETAKK